MTVMEKRKFEGEPADIAPITGQTVIIKKPKKCKCKKKEEDAELQAMLKFYSWHVKNARDTGYQAADDPGYSDPGLGFHKVGNCADWMKVSWAALVVRKWKCWNVHKIRARKHWTLLTFHHFVELESTCKSRPKRQIYLDPWKSGKPTWWPAGKFPFADGVNWGHTRTATHKAGDKPRDPND